MANFVFYCVATCKHLNNKAITDLLTIFNQLDILQLCILRLYCDSGVCIFELLTSLTPVLILNNTFVIRKLC